MAHEKLKSFFVMLAVFGCVGAIGWAVVQSHANSEVFPSLTPSPQVLTLDAATQGTGATFPTSPTPNLHFTSSSFMEDAK